MVRVKELREEGRYEEVEVYLGEEVIEKYLAIDLNSQTELKDRAKKDNLPNKILVNNKIFKLITNEKFADKNKYYINEDGVVYSIFGSRLLKPQSWKADYAHYMLKMNTEKGRYTEKTYVHQLVADSYLGKKPRGLVVNHIDNNYRNNKASNLEYITQLENLSKDKSKRMTAEEATKVYLKYMLNVDSFNSVEVALEHDVSVQSVHSVIHKLTYKDLTDALDDELDSLEVIDGSLVFSNESELTDSEELIYIADEEDIIYTTGGVI